MARSLLAPLFAVLVFVAAGCSKQADCKGTAQVCDGSCVELKSDNLNCGACGTACSAGQVCSNGACAVTCAAGLVNCGGRCIDPQTDRTFCGASGACVNPVAGTMCVDGEVCSAGRCALSCQQGLTDCNGTCANTQTDDANCGACGTVCDAGQVCSAGSCLLSCQAGLVNCGGKCVDPASDRSFCGASGACTGASGGTVCASGEVCAGGACAPNCPAGQVSCGGKCVDPMTDRAYCGASGDCAGPNDGTACAPGQVCSGGACALSCQGGLTDCAGTCTNTLSDDQHCGACGNVCAAGQVCSAGQCQLSCQAGLLDCGGKCVDPMTDRAFCGASGACSGPTGGAVCASGELCDAGTCAPSCLGGQVLCGGRCVDPMTDRAYCGASGDCAGPNDGTACAAGQVCSGGACALSCQGGLTDCAGLCVNVSSDRDHCGMCGGACAAGQVCSGGQCRLSCQAGLVDCGGKCVDPMTDRAFCGASGACAGPEDGTVCAAGQVCSAGACALSCQVGLTNCAGTCADTLSDDRHCGACGNVCAAGQVCNAGQCQLSCQAGLLDCGGKCVDPMTDRAFCGASGACSGSTGGAVCASGELCDAGTCAPSCLGGQVLCGGKCVDPMTDRAYCGASGDCAGPNDGAACAAGQVCSGGACALSCQGGLTDCAGQCVNVSSDRDHCGMCGGACAAGQVCSGGQCRLSCQAGLVDCGGKCVDPMTDRAFCGASGACAGPEDGTVCAAGQVCSAGACALSCQAGLVDCGGTCVDPQRDPRYCGADAACGTGQTCGDGFACDAGQCVLSCQAGLVDCGGRCVDPLTDRAFCGASGACAGATAGLVCAAGEVCTGGACAANCPDGQVACGGRCVDPLYDPDYCGAGPACAGGNGCQAGEACYQGVCHALCAPGTVMCGGACIDPLTDAAYCGASGYCSGAEAGSTCTASETCRSGACTPDCVTAAFDLSTQPPASTLRGGAIGGQGVATVAGRTAWLQTSDWNQLWMPSGLRAWDDVISVEADVYLPASAAGGASAVIALYSAGTDHWNFGALHVVAATSAEVAWGATPSLGGAAVVLRSSATTAVALDAWHRLRLEHEVATCTYRLLLDSTPVDAWVGPCEPAPSHYFLQSSGPGFQPTNFAWSNLRVDIGGSPTCLPSCPGGLVRCGGACVDPATDVNYCGASGACTDGVACGPAQECLGGACRDLPPPCVWTDVAVHGLTTSPAGAVARTSPIGTQSAAAAYGRTAWLQTGDWNVFLVPQGIPAGEDVFAIEVEVFLPVHSPGKRMGLLDLFTQNQVNIPCQQTGGVGVLAEADSAGLNTIRWYQSPTNYCAVEATQRQVASIASPAGAWRKMRVEGSRSACRFAVTVEGVGADVYDPADCSLPGGYVALHGGGDAGENSNIAWSNLRIQTGTATCAP